MFTDIYIILPYISDFYEGIRHYCLIQQYSDRINIDHRLMNLPVYKHIFKSFHVHKHVHPTCNYLSASDVYYGLKYM